MKQPLYYRGPEGEETDKGPETLFEEILAENFTNLNRHSGSGSPDSWN